MRHSKKSKLRYSFMVIASLLILYIVTFFYYTSIIRYHDNMYDDDARHAVILTGGELRLQAGFDLLEKQQVDKIFISGVHRGVSLKQLLHFYTQNNDKISCCVMLGYYATDTVSNAKESIEWVRDNNINTFYLITSNYHMPRALLLFNHYSQLLTNEEKPVITAYSVNNIGDDIHTIIESSDVLSLLAIEYNKWLVTHIYITLHNWVL